MRVKDFKTKIKTGTITADEASMEISKMFLIADLAESITIDLVLCTTQDVKKALADYYTASKLFRTRIENYVKSDDFLEQLGEDSDEIRETFNAFITNKQ